MQGGKLARPRATGCAHPARRPRRAASAAAKTPAARALDNVGLAPAASPPPPPKAAASAPPAPAPQKASSFEDMVTNSIAQKEAVLGRTLSEAEKAQLVSKLKALLQ